MFNQGSQPTDDTDDELPDLLPLNSSTNNVSLPASPVPASAVPTPDPTSTAPNSIPVYNTVSDPIPTRLVRSGYSCHYAYYAVARGLRPGVYTCWSAAKLMVHGVHGNKHKGFQNLDKAANYCRTYWRVLTRTSAAAAAASVASSSHATPASIPDDDEVLAAQIIWHVCVQRTSVTVIYLVLLKHVQSHLAGRILRAIKYGTDADQRWGPLRALAATIDGKATRSLSAALLLLSKTPAFKGCSMQSKCFSLLQHAVLHAGIPIDQVLGAIRGIARLDRSVRNHLLLTLKKAVTGEWNWTRELCADLDDGSACRIVATIRLLQ